VQAELRKALGAYNDLLELQAQRFLEGSAKYATSRAEALKLIGNVYVALRQWERYELSERPQLRFSRNALTFNIRTLRWFEHL
jgi:hypothetical protein